MALDSNTDVTYAPSPVTIPQALASAVDAHGDRTAVVEGDTHLSYADLDEASGGVAAALVAAGVQKGDRVAIWAPNRARWIVALFGLARAGATLVPVNTRFKGREAADILVRSGARVLVTVTDFLGADHVSMLRDADVDLPALETIVVMDGPVASGTITWDDFLATATVATRAEADRRAAAATDDDPSDILFTSGTTGVPKGVVQTHGRTMTVARDWVAMTGLRSDDRYLMVNPYFHMFGLKAGILASVTAGATMYPEPVFDVARAVDTIGREGITVFPGAPTLYQSLLDHPPAGNHDLSTLRVAVTGAADIPVELIRRIIDDLPFELVIAGYGLTEGGTASATDPGDDPEVIATTVGRARPSFELRIVDAQGDEVPTGEAGEILLRGASVMSHYLDDPEATAAVLSDDGWLRTGDLGTLDADGRLRIVGRSKDMFIVGGFNAYPAEIENALLRHPDIGQAAVIGVPDERLGEVGMAFVVLTAGATTTPDEIVSWAREQMANYKAPRHVEVLDELPLNATGKVEKLVLAQRATEVLGR
jgi:acyl-CoA synthetase (AMP-forming)/AMP-acid ligase II